MTKSEEWNDLKYIICYKTDKLTDDEIEKNRVIIKKIHYSFYDYKFFLVNAGFLQPYTMRKSEFRIIKRIPKDLSYKELKKLSKVNHKSSYLSKWDRLINYINTQSDVFDFNPIPIIINECEYCDHDIYNRYMGLLCKIGYVELIDHKKSQYKLIKEIPDNLSTNIALKMAYDKFYKRAFKIKNIRERMNNNTNNNDKHVVG